MRVHLENAWCLYVLVQTTPLSLECFRHWDCWHPSVMQKVEYGSCWCMLCVSVSHICAIDVALEAVTYAISLTTDLISILFFFGILQYVLMLARSFDLSYVRSYVFIFNVHTSEVCKPHAYIAYFDRTPSQLHCWLYIVRKTRRVTHIDPINLIVCPRDSI